MTVMVIRRSTGTSGWMARGLLAAVIGLPVAVVGVGLGGCTTNPATGKSIFTMGMSRQTQISLGNQAAPQFRQEMGGSVPDERLQRYVDDIGRRMAALTEGDNPSLPWEFNLVNTSQVNAFALPGGKVFFTRGLAEKLTSEAQMAGVIGHEIGHVTAEHGAQRMASTIAFNAGLVATAVIVGVSGDRDLQRIAAVGVPAIAVGGNLVLLKFGRNEELEADRLGVRYMVGPGYNPRGQMEVMQVLASLSTGPRPPEFLSTHPDPMLCNSGAGEGPDKFADHVELLVSGGQRDGCGSVPGAIGVSCRPIPLARKSFATRATSAASSLPAPQIA
ncbi:M48 family metalloprotease [Leptolyngbya sp. 15MV]|nr:M48 family metalloprotease [Leptolyngbya sp. 15MV]